VDGSKSYDPDENLPVGFETKTEATTHPLYTHQERSRLMFRWSFAVQYYRNGQPVPAIPEGSKVFQTIEGFDTEVACFTPDLPGKYVLVLTVTDDYGASLVDEVTVVATECGTVCGCSYPAGWNLISLCSQPIDPHVESVLADVDVRSETLTYEGGYQPVEVMVPTGGYWLYFFSPDRIDLQGRMVAADMTLDLPQRGWYLIGTPYPIAWNDVSVVADGSTWPMWQAENQGLIEIGPICYDPVDSVYRESTGLVPCQGYWVKSGRNGISLLLKWNETGSYLGSEDCEGVVSSVHPPSPPTGSSLQQSVKVYPIPVRHSAVHFVLEGYTTAEAIRVFVYNLSREQIWSGEAAGIRLDWDVLGTNGEHLARGPYIYRIDVLVNGSWQSVGRGTLILAEE
jgi:hypothetical protein